MISREDAEYVEEELAREMAQFCLATGMPPSEYIELTVIERSAFVEEWNKIQKKKGGKA